MIIIYYYIILYNYIYNILFFNILFIIYYNIILILLNEFKKLKVVKKKI